VAALKIEDLLKDLADDGVRESSGSFTLDPKKAEEKLRGFSFASPHHYLLKLVQCAVAGGATGVAISTGASEIRIEFDGETMQPEDVDSLMGYLLSDKVSHNRRRFRHLAAALRGGAALEPEAVIFDFSTGSSRVRRVWDEIGWRQTESPSGDAQGPHVFVLDRTLGQSMSAAKEELLSALSSNDTPEESELRGRCGYTSCEIRLDDQLLPAIGFGEPRYPGYEIASDPNPGEARPPHYVDKLVLIDKFMVGGHHLVEKLIPSSQERPGNLPLPDSQATVSLGRPDNGPCYAWLAVTAQLATPKLVYVEDGVVLLEQEAPEIPLPGFYAVISGAGFNKDLTGFQIVQDHEHESFRAWLLKQATEMAEALDERIALFPNRLRIRQALS
jgi:hypothetical protein